MTYKGSNVFSELRLTPDIYAHSPPGKFQIPNFFVSHTAHTDIYYEYIGLVWRVFSLSNVSILAEPIYCIIDSSNYRVNSLHTSISNSISESGEGMRSWMNLWNHLWCANFCPVADLIFVGVLHEAKARVSLPQFKNCSAVTGYSCCSELFYRSICHMGLSTNFSNCLKT